MGRKLRVGFVGVGDCASSFEQALSRYRGTPANEPVPGLTRLTSADVLAALDRPEERRRSGRRSTTPDGAQVLH